MSARPDDFLRASLGQLVRIGRGGAGVAFDWMHEGRADEVQRDAGGLSQFQDVSGAVDVGASDFFRGLGKIGDGGSVDDAADPICERAENILGEAKPSFRNVAAHRF